MERWKLRAAKMLTELMIYDKPSPRAVPFVPEKTEIIPPSRPSLPRTSAESQGLSSAKLADMLEALEAEKRASIHSVLVLKNGKIVAEASAPGYDARLIHLCYSMAKTVTGIALGILWDEKRIDLDTPVVTYFPEVEPYDKKFADVTVEDLLTMRAGVHFAEVGSVTEEKWTEAFFHSPVEDIPGTTFYYNSINSYLLSRIVARVSGKTLGAFVEERIFTPLGIREYLWEKSVEGDEKGGFGLYLSAESFAKIGILLCDGGLYRERRVVSEEWVRRSTEIHSTAAFGSFDYGYHVWVNREGDDFLLNGMLGQNVLVNPKEKLVAVVTAGNNELFSESPALSVVRAAFADLSLPESAASREIRDGQSRLAKVEKTFFLSRLPVRPLEERRGIAAFLHLAPKRPFPDVWNRILGKMTFVKNNRSTLPLLFSLFHNNIPGGIRSMTFERVGSSLFLSVEEGENTVEMPIGLYDFEQTVLKYEGESYLVRTLGSFRFVEGKCIFDLLMIFPELPHTRVLTFVEKESRVYSVSLTETPNERIAETYLAGLKNSKTLAAGLALLSRYTGGDPVSDVLKRGFRPTLLAVSDTLPNAAELLAAAEAAEVESLAKMRFLSDLFNQYLGDDESKKPSIFNLLSKK